MQKYFADVLIYDRLLNELQKIMPSVSLREELQKSESDNNTEYKPTEFCNQGDDDELVVRARQIGNLRRKVN